MKRGLAAVLLTLCLAGTAAAQQAGRVYRVALLAPGEASVANTRQYTLPVLERAGFVEGRNLVLEVRETGGSSERSAAAAAELAAWRPDAVIAVANGAVAAVRRAMPTTPVLMAFSDDPVGQGFVQSLARPGGWATGVALQSTEANRKRLELARELMPSAKASSARVGIVLPCTYTELQRADLRRAATDLDVEVVFVEATAPSDYAAAFAALRAARCRRGHGSQQLGLCGQRLGAGPRGPCGAYRVGLRVARDGAGRLRRRLRADAAGAALARGRTAGAGIARRAARAGAGGAAGALRAGTEPQRRPEHWLRPAARRAAARRRGDRMKRRARSFCPARLRHGLRGRSPGVVR